MFFGVYLCIFQRKMIWILRDRNYHRSRYSGYSGYSEYSEYSGYSEPHRWVVFWNCQRLISDQGRCSCAAKDRERFRKALIIK